MAQRDTRVICRGVSLSMYSSSDRAANQQVEFRDALGTVSAMPDPFKLFGRLLIAGVRIAGYFAVFVGQALWYLVCRQPVRIGDAAGYFGRGVVDAVGDILK